MTFLNVIIAIFLVLILLFLALWLSPLWIRIRYVETFTVYAGLGPVRMKLYPSKEKEKKKKKPKKKKNQKTTPAEHRDEVQKEQHTEVQNEPIQREKSDTQNKQTVKKGTQKKADDEMGVKEVLDFVLDILTRVIDLFHKRAKIKIDALRVVVSKPDAADTAIQFGLCSGIVSSILAFTSNFGKSVIKDKNISVVPDFITGKSSVETDVTLSVRVCYAAIMLLKMFYDKTFK